MTEDYHAGAKLSVSAGEERYQAGPSENLIASMAVQLNAQLREHDRAIATHDGLIKGIQTALSSVQGSVAAALTLGGIAIAALFGMAIFNVTRTNSVGDRVDSVAEAVSVRGSAVEVRVGAVESQMKILPQQVAHELAQQQQDRANIRRRPGG